MRQLKVVFMGTPEFAVTILDGLVQHGVDIAGVITAPDKPAGRGRKIHESAVKKYAVNAGFKLLQPTNLKDPVFIEELEALNADLQIVVAFRMLPEAVWNMPPLGTFNLHASLLPQYRGAAPINWAIINGEQKSGVTTFFLEHKIDTGNIILQESIDISSDMTAGELHDQLMHLGVSVVNRTYDLIAKGNAGSRPQNEMQQEQPLKEAPKIFKEDCRINWSDSIDDVFNKIRGLSPYPTAWTMFKDDQNQERSCKIFRTEKVREEHGLLPGTIRTDEKSFLHIYGVNGFVRVTELQLEGKKKMDVEDFLRGAHITNKWRAE